MKYVLLCLLLSFLPACRGTEVGLAVKVPVFGELQFRANPVAEVADAVKTVSDGVGITGSDPAK